MTPGLTSKPPEFTDLKQQRHRDVLSEPVPVRVVNAWTGYGGVGDYQFSNGSTAGVVCSAHQIRNGAYERDLPNLIDANEQYDALIVGGRFAGLSALYEFQKRKPHGKYLMLDNHLIFGGFAKSNESDVDGYRVAGLRHRSILFCRSEHWAVRMIIGVN